MMELSEEAVSTLLETLAEMRETNEYLVQRAEEAEKKQKAAEEYADQLAAELTISNNKCEEMKTKIENMYELKEEAAP